MIGRSGERGSGISVLAARHDDDDGDENYEINNRIAANEVSSELFFFSLQLCIIRR